MVTWQSYQNATGYDVYVRVYNANGVARTTELPVSPPTGNYYSPEITSLNNGDFVVTWESVQTTNYYARIYDADGIVRMDDFAVSINSITALSGVDFDFISGNSLFKSSNTISVLLPPTINGVSLSYDFEAYDPKLVDAVGFYLNPVTNKLYVSAKNSFVGQADIKVTAWSGGVRGVGRSTDYIYKLDFTADSVNLALPTATGKVFDDNIQNGVFDINEKGLEGWTVYVDSNNDGQLNAGEVQTTTDANGRYTFTNLLQAGATVHALSPDNSWNLSGQSASDIGYVHKISVGADLRVQEGVPVKLTAESLGLTSLAWSIVDQNGDIFNQGTGAVLNFTPPNQGYYTVTYSGADVSGQLYSDSLSLFVDNSAPVVSLGVDRLVTGKAPVLFEQAYSDVAADMSSMLTNWTVLDASNHVVTGVMSQVNGVWQFNPREVGVYTITLTATDPEGAVTSGSVKITVGYSDPVVNLGTDQTGILEGSTVVFTDAYFDSGFSSQQTQVVSTVITRLSDNTLISANSNAWTWVDHTLRFTPPDNDIYQIDVIVTDKDALTASGSVTVTAINVAPSALVIVGTAFGNEGESLNYSAQFTDPGSLESHVYLWQVKDQQNNVIIESQEANFNFTPVNEGRYTLLLTVTDKDNAVSGSIDINIANTAPTSLVINSPEQLVEGDLVKLTANFFDAGVLDMAQSTYHWQVIADNGQIIADGMDNTFSFVPENQGNYSVTLTITDNGGLATSLQKTLVVANKAPVVSGLVQLDGQGTLIGSGVGTLFNSTEGSSFSLRADASDLASDVLSYDWRIKDASGQTIFQEVNGAVLNSDVFGGLQAGDYSIFVNVSDKDGGQTELAQELHINNATPSFMADSLSKLTKSGLFLGAATLEDDLIITSPRLGADSLRAEIDFGDGVVQNFVIDKNTDSIHYNHTYTQKPTGTNWQGTVKLYDEEGVSESNFEVGVIDGPTLTRTGGAQLVTLTEGDNITLTEGDNNSYFSYALSLNGVPTSDVLVDLLSDAQVQFWDKLPSETTRQEIHSVSFTTADWSAAKMVYVTARDDDRADGLVDSQISHRIVTDDGRIKYQLARGNALADLFVTTQDNDAAAGFTVKPVVNVDALGNYVTTEAGDTASFSVELNSQPDQDVTLTVYSTNNAEGRLPVNVLHFTAQTWDIPQIIIVKGVGDNGATLSNDQYQVSFSVSGDVNFVKASPASLNFINNNVAAPTSPPLKVTSFTQTSSGFVLTFSEAVDSSVINLIESKTISDKTGTVDLEFKRGAILQKGSLLFDSTGRTATFIAAGSVLSPGNYSLTLKGNRLDSDGFVAKGFHTLATDQTLDGDLDGIAGGDYQASFTVANFNGPIASIADFARGPGQIVNALGASRGKLPIILNAGSATSGISISTIDISLDYDSTLLQLNSVIGGIALPTNATVSYKTDSVTGKLTVTINSPTPFNLSGAALELLVIDAEVPQSASYGLAELLHLTMSINGGAIISKTDDAVHLAAYLGDTSNDGKYSVVDIQALNSVSAVSVSTGIITHAKSLNSHPLVRVNNNPTNGFSAYARLDPSLIGDITSSATHVNPNGVIDSNDTKALQDEVSGVNRSEIPALPVVDLSQAIFKLGTVTGTIDSFVSLPITISQLPMGAQLATIQLAFDEKFLQLINVSKGDLTLGFDNLTISHDATGKAVIDLTALLRSQRVNEGKIADIQFKIIAGNGSVSVDLRKADLDNPLYILGQQPVPGIDASDGSVIVGAALQLQKPINAVLSTNANLVSINDLTTTELSTLTGAAISQWLTAQPAIAENLANVQFEITNLPLGMLGFTIGNKIQLDRNAAGAGWFIDNTPLDNNEFIKLPGDIGYLATANGPAVGQVDLLSVLEHELGHLAGLEHSATGIMAETLSPGVRVLPDLAALTVKEPVPSDNNNEIPLPKIKLSRTHGKHLDELELKEGSDWLSNWVQGGHNNVHEKQKDSWKIRLPKH